jgi:hypothetical protein
MKRYIIMFMAVAAILASCNSDDMHEADAMSVTTITFTMTGDFQLTAHDFTRSLEADGKTMTDVWVFDYMGGILQQQVHQTSADADFGTPTLSLALGEHHIYFVASRGTGATLNTDAHTLTFTKVLDNFWKDYAITITGGTDSGSRAVVLDRIVTKLKVVFSDEPPCGSLTECEKTAAQSAVETALSKEHSDYASRRSPGSISFVPSVMGLILAGEVIKDISAVE